MWKCVTCGKTVKIKNKKLSCCGITEDLSYAESAAKQSRRNLRKTLSPLFDPIIDVWNDDENEFEYEGIPNT